MVGRDNGDKHARGRVCQPSFETSAASPLRVTCQPTVLHSNIICKKRCARLPKTTALLVAGTTAECISVLVLSSTSHRPTASR